MLIFEYTRRMDLQPTDLINHAPLIWRWTNPALVVADFYSVTFGALLDVSPANRYIFVDAKVGTRFLANVYTYADLLLVPYSFYWDRTNQIGYFHFPYDVHPFTFPSMSLSRVYGATDEEAIVFDGILYPTILLSKPVIRREVEPVVYQKLATQSLSVQLRNDMVYTIDSVTHKPILSYRFDDLSDITGQTTYWKYGADGCTYEQLKVLHKGIIVDYDLKPNDVTFECDDKRTMQDAEWPTYTYQNAGYDETDVEEGKFTEPIPDGYGPHVNMPCVCVNRTKCVLEFDEDDIIVNMPESRTPYDLLTWSNSGFSTFIKANVTISGFPYFFAQKAAATENTGNIVKSFRATKPTQKFSGYIMRGTQGGVTRLELYDATSVVSLAQLDIDMGAETFVSNYGGLENVRVKFIKNDGSNVQCYYSFEYTAFDITVDNVFAIWTDLSATASYGYFAGIKITDADYATYRVARTVTADGLHLYKEEDDKLVELTNIIDIDEENGTVKIHDVDAHADGSLSDDLVELFCTANLRILEDEATLHSLSFDGTDDYVVLGELSEQTDAPISFSAMIKWNGQSTPYSGIWGYTNTAADNCHFEIRDDGMRLRLGDLNQTGMTLPPVGEWCKVAFDYADGVAHYYLDDVLQATITATTGTILGTLDVHSIGDSNADTIDTRPFDGLIRDVYINTMHYPFDEATGTEVFDTTNTGDIGTIDGAVWYYEDILVENSNAFNVIADLNYQALGLPYIDSMYHTALCEAEKAKLSDISLYKNGKQSVSSIIEEIQNGSVIGFRYDDVDKIYIMCDDPNRVKAMDILSHTILNKADLSIKGNMTLYADKVSVEYGNDGWKKTDAVYTNDTYSNDVLLRYNYERPKDFPSLLLLESDAINKSIVLLEDLSVTRPLVNVHLHGLDLLDVLDLYSIVTADLTLRNRPYVGTLRMQVIGIEVDTKFEFIYLTLRQRDYSDLVAGIIDSYGTAFVIGHDTTVIGSGETAIGTKET